jgi:hypothetical protein
MMSFDDPEVVMERMIVIQDPTLTDVRYVVHVAAGATCWYRVENDVHEFLPSPERLRPLAQGADEA